MLLLPIIFIFTLLAAFPIFGSQHDTQQPANIIIIEANVDVISYNPLRINGLTNPFRLCGQEYVNACKNFNIVTELGHLCFPIHNYTTLDTRADLAKHLLCLQSSINCTPNKNTNISQQLIQSWEQEKKDINTPKNQQISAALDELQHIHYLPLKFLLNQDNNTFTTLFEFSRDIEQQTYVFKVQIKTKLSSDNLKEFLESFKKNPLCSTGVFDKKSIAFDSGKEKVQQELIAANILIKSPDGTITIGPNAPQELQMNKNCSSIPSWHSYAKPCILLLILLAGSAFFIQYLRLEKTAY